MTRKPRAAPHVVPGYYAWTSKDFLQAMRYVSDDFTVKDGKFAQSRFVLDRAPFQAMREANLSAP